ncbi:unnamed protein product [Boreogadus saida]
MIGCNDGAKLRFGNVEEGQQEGFSPHSYPPTGPAAQISLKVQCRSEESSLCGMGGWRWWVGAWGPIQEHLVSMQAGRAGRSGLGGAARGP